MTPFDNLRLQLAKMIAGKSKTIYDQNSSPYVPHGNDPPKRSTQEWLETYGKSPRLSVITKISEDLAFVPGRLICKNAKGQDEDLPATHPFWRFWNQPNPIPQLTRESIWQLHQIYLLLMGEAFMIVEKDFLGFPAELWPLPPNWVSGTPSAGNPYYNVRMPSGMVGQVHVNDMLVQMELNPLNPYGRGLGQAQSIADEVEIDEYASAFEKRFFYNDATPSSLIGIEGADADAIKRFEASWNNRFQGVENSHRTAVASGKVSVAKLADNMKDLDMVNGRLFLRNSVLEHFHIPREIMGITENSNRSTAEAAQYIYAQNVLTPHIKKRATAINTQLIPYWGENIRYEYSEIIPRNQEYDKAVAVEGWNSGLLELNESRSKLDMEPLPNGNIRQAPLLFGYVSSAQDLTAMSTPAAEGGVSDYYDTVYEETDPDTGQKETKSRISNLDQQAIRQLERAQREQMRRAESAATRYFDRQRENILTAFKGGGKESKAAGEEAAAGSTIAALTVQLEEITSPLARAEAIAHYVDSMVDWTQDEEQVRRLLVNTWSSTYEKGQDIMSRLYDLKNPYKPEVRDVFIRMGGQKIASDISGTTRSKIIDIIGSGLEKSESMEEIGQRISDCSELSPYRAQLIARQETYNSLSKSNFDTMKECGIRRHKWATTGKENVRMAHRKMNGQVREIGQPFSNGLLYPRDRDGTPEQVINCCCWAVPLRERNIVITPNETR